VPCRFSLAAARERQDVTAGQRRAPSISITGNRDDAAHKRMTCFNRNECDEKEHDLSGNVFGGARI
jgi:hypothetical protein